MSERPTQCKFCGCTPIGNVGARLLFRCKSYWNSSCGRWAQGTNCKHDLLVDRVRRASLAIESAERFDLRPLGDYQGEGMVRDDKHGEWVESQVLDTVLKILTEDAGAKNEQAET